MAQTLNGGIPQECLRDWLGQYAKADQSKTPAEPAGSNDLNRTIESEIIPRLMMLFDLETGAGVNDSAAPAAGILGHKVEEFVQLILQHDAEVAREFIEKLQAAGIPLQSIYLDLLAPAARQLGALWESDDITFTMVTIAVARMHQVLLQFSPCFCGTEGEDLDSRHSALIVPAPGEQHTFGMFMAVEFFRRGGWNVWSGTPDGVQELLDLVRSHHFDIVGFSVSSDRHVDQLGGWIAEVRKHSSNGDTKVMVGGRIFAENTRLHNELGADAVALNGDDGVHLAESLISRTG